MACILGLVLLKSRLQPKHALFAYPDKAAARPIEIKNRCEHHGNQHRKDRSRSMTPLAREPVAVADKAECSHRDGEQQMDHGLRHVIVEHRAALRFPSRSGIQ